VRDLIQQGKVSTSAFLKQGPKPSAVRTPFSGSPQSKANTRSGTAIPRRKSCRSLKNLESASFHSALSEKVSPQARSTKPRRSIAPISATPSRGLRQGLGKAIRRWSSGSDARTAEEGDPFSNRAGLGYSQETQDRSDPGHDKAASPPRKPLSDRRRTYERRPSRGDVNREKLCECSDTLRVPWSSGR
jgi:hypothetical protein